MLSEPLEGQFLINGKQCSVRLESDCIIWSPVLRNGTEGKIVSDSKQIKSKAKRQDGDKTTGRIAFDHMIGTIVREKVTKLQINENKIRFKVYYCKQTTSRSSRQLLKLKKITIKVSKQTTNQHDNKRTQQQPCSAAAAAAELKSDTSKTGELTLPLEPIKETTASTNGSNDPPPSCYASEGSTSHLSSLSAAAAAGFDGSQTLSRSPAPHSDSESSSLRSSNGTDLSAEQRCQSPSTAIGTACGCLSMQTLMERIEEALKQRRKLRPNRLLVFVNPCGGKGRALNVYKSQVRRLLDLAQVDTTLVVTKYANHAQYTVEDVQFNVEQFDGVVCVGGDGMFSELMNGLLFRYNRDNILLSQLQSNANSASTISTNTTNYKNDCDINAKAISDTSSSSSSSSSSSPTDDDNHTKIKSNECQNDDLINNSKTNTIKKRLDDLRSSLGGIGKQFQSPPIPIGVIGAGSTDANSFGLIGTNDVITATLNIILGNRIKIDICSVHSILDDRLDRFVSTFAAYGYFGDVIRESEKLRWLGPSRYDVTGVNNLLKNRTYSGKLSILTSNRDGSPLDLERCHVGCERCCASEKEGNTLRGCDYNDFNLVEKSGSFVGINAAVTACRCPQTKKGFSPNNHLANGCADLILVRSCSRIQYLQYLLRIGYTKKSAFDLGYVETFRCRQFEFISAHQNEQSGSTSTGSSANSSLDQSSNSSSLDCKNSNNNDIRNDEIMRTSKLSSWNVDGEVLNKQSIRVKVNNRLLTVFGTGEPRL